MKHEFLEIVYLRHTIKHCVKCEGTELSLPTECPGKPMSDYQEIGVMADEINYIGGKWLSNAA